MKLRKQVKFIQGENLKDLEDKLNEALAKGAQLGSIDIQSLTGAIIVNEYVGEIKKTLLDELEDAFGTHYCCECPYFEKSKDKRVKWHNCSRHGRKVMEKTKCCEQYYREEGARDLSKDKRENERTRPQNGRPCRYDDGFTADRIRPFKREKQIPSVGMRIVIENAEHTARGFV